MSYVLIADDEADFREGMAELLADHGYRVVQAADGDQALDLMKAERPALLVTDIVMPRMTGDELVAHMAADPALRDIPYCVISASVHLPPLPGACAVLQKPFPPMNLVDIVARWLRGQVGG